MPSRWICNRVCDAEYNSDIYERFTEKNVYKGYGSVSNSKQCLCGNIFMFVYGICECVGGASTGTDKDGN